MYRDDCEEILDSRLDGDTRQFRLPADGGTHSDRCANVYLDSPYYKGHSKVMCVSSPVIIGNVRGAHQMLPDPVWKAEDQREARARTSEGNNNDADNQDGDMPSWMFKEKSNRGKTKNRDSKKKPAQIKKNDNHATQDVSVQEGTTEEKCVAGPVLTNAQAKKSDKIHPLKVKEVSTSLPQKIFRRRILLQRNALTK